MGLGQFTGPRSKYVYTNDFGVDIVLRLDETNVIATSGLLTYDPETDVDVIPKPLGFKPRGVYWQATATGFEGKRKFLIAGLGTAGIYASDTPQIFSIDGVAGVTTGRRGEVQSYL